MGDRAGPAYQLDELGWLQFERLARLLLATDAGLDELPFVGAADRLLHCTVDGPVRLTARPGRLDGPLLVAVAWLGSRVSPADRPRVLARRLAPLDGERIGACLILANLDDRAGAAALTPQFETETVLGHQAVGAGLDRHPQVRAALPSVLGHRDLAGFISAPARGSSNLDLDAAQQLARVFWPTRAYERARQTLERHRFVVLTGPPEMGKTAIARMLALAMMSDGWEAHECSTPEQLWRATTPAGGSCSSPTTPSARPSTGPRRPSAGRSRSRGCSRCSTTAIA